MSLSRKLSLRKMSVNTLLLTARGQVFENLSKQMKFKILQQLQTDDIVEVGEASPEFGTLIVDYLACDLGQRAVYDEAEKSVPGSTPRERNFACARNLAIILTAASCYFNSSRKMKALQDIIIQMLEQERGRVSERLGLFFRSFSLSLTVIETKEATYLLQILTGYQMLRHEVFCQLPGKAPQKEMRLRLMHIMLFHSEPRTAMLPEECAYYNLTYYQKAMLVYITLGPVSGGRIAWKVFQAVVWSENYESFLDRMILFLCQIAESDLLSTDLLGIMNELIKLPTPWLPFHVERMKMKFERRSGKRLLFNDRTGVVRFPRK